MHERLAAPEIEAILRPTDVARGLPSRTYTSPEWARIERDTVLASSWTCVGFTADVPDPGSAAPVEILGLPLLLVRGADAAIRVFHNVCRHRGHRLVGGSCRLRGAIRCPYHSWTYGLDGRLRGTPHIGGPGVHEAQGFDREAHGLWPVRSETWCGLVFVDLSGEAPALAEHLAPLLARWETFAGDRDLGLLRDAPDGAAMEIEVRANWKLAIENYCESYHLPWVHPGLNEYSRLEDHYPILGSDRFSGQGTLAFSFSERAGIRLPWLPGWPEERRSQAEYVALYPNLLLGLQVDHLFAMVIVPLAHDRTLERVRIRYVGDDALGPRHADARRTTLEGWRVVFAEDVSAVEGLQAGRASPAFDGGAFSPVMDTPTHHFHRWMASRPPAETATAGLRAAT